MAFERAVGRVWKRAWEKTYLRTARAIYPPPRSPERSVQCSWVSCDPSGRITVNSPGLADPLVVWPPQPIASLHESSSRFYLIRAKYWASIIQQITADDSSYLSPVRGRQLKLPTLLRHVAVSWSGFRKFLNLILATLLALAPLRCSKWMKRMPRGLSVSVQENISCKFPSPVYRESWIFKAPDVSVNL